MIRCRDGWISSRHRVGGATSRLRRPCTVHAPHASRDVDGREELLLHLPDRCAEIAELPVVPVTRHFEQKSAAPRAVRFCATDTAA